MDEERSENCVIKDLDTGRQFVVNATGEITEAENEGAAGKQLSMDEFDKQLGIGMPSPRANGEVHSGSLSSFGSTESSRNSPNKGSPNTSSHRKKFPWVKNAGKRKGSGGSGEMDSQREDSQASFSGHFHPLPPSPLHPSNPHMSTPASQAESAKVTTYKRQHKELSDLRLVQEIKYHQGVVWVLKFSPNGLILATGGKDTVICLWEIIPKRGHDGEAGRTELPVLRSEPLRVWKGHKSDVLDIAWSSESDFVLSASIDKSVRLWHVTKDECLRDFPHQNYVTAISFHPSDPGRFVSGSGDGVLRMWNVMSRRVVGSASITGDSDLYTAVCFSEDGKTLLAGSYKGKCRLYEIGSRGIEKRAEIDVKNRRGKHSRGKKVTGIEYIKGSSQPRFVVTTNDSRIRLLQGVTIPKEVSKFKGHANESGRPIHASPSPRGEYIICGSDNGQVYVWPTSQTPSPPSTPSYTTQSREKVSASECFRAHEGTCTCAVFAPDTCRRPFAFLDTGLRSTSGGSGGVGGVCPPLAKMQYIMFQSQAQQEGGEDLTGVGLWGQVLVTSGSKGEIRLWENFGPPIASC